MAKARRACKSGIRHILERKAGYVRCLYMIDRNTHPNDIHAERPGATDSVETSPTQPEHAAKPNIDIPTPGKSDLKPKVRKA